MDENGWATMEKVTKVAMDENSNASPVDVYALAERDTFVKSLGIEFVEARPRWGGS